MTLKLKQKTSSFRYFSRQMFLSSMRTMCVIAMAYYVAKAVLDGTNTLGTAMYACFPVFAIGGILLLIELNKWFFPFSLLLPLTPNAKTFKMGIAFAVIGLIAGALLLYTAISNAMSLVMISLVILAAGFSAVLMLRAKSVEAICVFILVWPFIIFENGHGLHFFQLNRYFDKIFNFAPEDWVTFLYVCLLLMCWIIRLLVKPRRLVPASFSFGIWLLAFAGIISAISSPYQISSLNEFVLVILLPVFLFFFFVNEIRSLNDLKKLSLALGCSMAIITLVWFYYAVYRDPTVSYELASFSSQRGAGGLVLGSKYPGYNGIYYDYLSPLILPSVLALSFTTNNRKIKIFWIAIAGLMICATFLTFGRIGWVVTFLCLLPWVWNIRHGRLLGFLSLLFLGLAIFYCQGVREVFSNVFSRFDLFFTSWSDMQAREIRLRIFKGSIQMFLDHPWTGIGVGMFSQYSGDYGLFVWSNDNISGEFIAQNVATSHGTLFENISTLGILGLISWGAMLWIPLRFIISKKGITKRGARASPWRSMLLSYSMVLAFFFFFGQFLLYGGDNIRIIIFCLWFAVISKKDNFLRDTPD